MAVNGIEDALKIAKIFQLEGEFVYVSIVRNGHINDTYSYQTSTNHYIIQRINKNVFHKPDEVMENIKNVTDYILEKVKARNGDVLRDVMTIIPTKDGKLFYIDENDDYWRVYIFVEDSVCYNKPTRPSMFEESGRAFGRFQRDLDGFPAENLHETIPHFHDTMARVEQLKEAYKNNKAGRADEVKDLYEKYMKEAYLADFFAKVAKEVPLRVTHNDTKLNNVLLDKYDGHALCVIDLDTIMPGLNAFDFGDSIRFGANKGDEEDVEHAALDIEMFKAYVKGFLDGCQGSLTPKEIDVLVEGAMDMTFECGIRFLADYLNGDVYFKTSYPEQNLRRATSQYLLLMDMEKHKEEMHKIVDSLK
ncbi:MAG: aminoglycoside phosphotransferase family protein [Bacilli bacterium]|nr:aminoglycoside phosphotransferase family protein [Bacilli bacterium]